MKLTKTVKYHYKLTEETLEKDIESFIQEARKGVFFWDYKSGGRGLKIIKRYFKLLQEKFDNQKYKECKICYGKLILFLFGASIGEDDANFGYEDLLSKVDKDFDGLIKNYFVCLVRTCKIEELTERVADYIIGLERAEYSFDSDIEILFKYLDENTLKNLEQKLLIKIESMTKKDEDKINILYFLMEIAKEQNDREKYLKLCGKLRGVVPDKEVDYIIWEFDEKGPEPEVF